MKTMTYLALIATASAVSLDKSYQSFSDLPPGAKAVIKKAFPKYLQLDKLFYVGTSWIESMQRTYEAAGFDGYLIEGHEELLEFFGEFSIDSYFYICLSIKIF